MRRFALFSDIHGNLAALDAVLADMDAADIDERYCLGDLVGYGPRPSEIIDRICSLGIPTVRGNYDDGVGNRRGECGCYYSTDADRRDGQASYEFTSAAVSDADARWLAALPDEIRFDAEGLRVLLVHGSPRRINEYMMPDRPEAQLTRLALEAGADLVCVGHVHVPYDRAMVVEGGRRVRYVSSGSVGKPKDGDSRACWVEAVVDGSGDVEAIVHRVAYDVEAVVAEMLEAGLPATLAEALKRG